MMRFPDGAASRSRLHRECCLAASRNYSISAFIIITEPTKRRWWRTVHYSSPRSNGRTPLSTFEQPNASDVINSRSAGQSTQPRSYRSRPSAQSDLPTSEKRGSDCSVHDLGIGTNPEPPRSILISTKCTIASVELRQFSNPPIIDRAGKFRRSNLTPQMKSQSHQEVCLTSGCTKPRAA